MSTINKYIDLVELQDTGEFISNIKHLRGSTMRMLRSNPDKPQFRILKAFSLFVLSDTVRELLSEAKEEMIRGIIDWRMFEDSKLNVEKFIIGFKRRIANHIVNYDIAKEFDDIEDRFYASYYATWTENFNKKFLITQF